MADAVFPTSTGSISVGLQVRLDKKRASQTVVERPRGTRPVAQVSGSDIFLDPNPHSYRLHRLAYHVGELGLDFW